MNVIQSKLQDFAKFKALPYLLEVDIFKPYIDELSFVLVGSAATGLCRPDSDVDIAIICNKQVYDIVSMGNPWESGRPTEVILEDIQLHYYAISYDEIENKLKELDDIYLYVYNNVVILRDVRNTYERKLRSLNSTDTRNKRLEGKLDMLLRRAKVLELCLNNKENILEILKICIEVITLSLKVISLLDNVQFDSRKRLYSTALQGVYGQKMEKKIRSLFSSLGDLESLGYNINYNDFRFLNTLKEIIHYISEEVRSQGLKVGLEKVDRRHIEK